MKCPNSVFYPCYRRPRTRCPRAPLFARCVAFRFCTSFSSDMSSPDRTLKSLDAKLVTPCIIWLDQIRDLAAEIRVSLRSTTRTGLNVPQEKFKIMKVGRQGALPETGLQFQRSGVLFLGPGPSWMSRVICYILVDP
jgi:hypothetical protein